MKRRAFIALLSSAVAFWPLNVRAQQASKRPTIGFVGPSTPAAWASFTAPFVQRLHQLGWADGNSVTIEYRWTDGHNERLPELVAELVQRKVDVLFAPTTVVAIAAKSATSQIPIVFALVGDPVAIGLAASLARPSGNVTGLSNQSVDLPGKRLGLLREVLPALRRLAILVNAGNPANVLESKGFETIARNLGLDVMTLEIRQADDIAPAFERLADKADALFVISDPLTLTNFPRINTLALSAKLPTMYGAREFVLPGGLMSYGANFPDLFRRAADYVDKILRGAKPADIPIEQPTKFDLVVNLATAKALGLKIPEAFLQRADEVIE